MLDDCDLIALRFEAVLRLIRGATLTGEARPGFFVRNVKTLVILAAMQFPHIGNIFMI